MSHPTPAQVVEALRKTFGDAVLEEQVHQGDTFVRVDAARIHDVLLDLRDTHAFIYLSDLFGIDRFTAEQRFEVCYNLVSLKHGTRIFVKTRVEETDPVLPTASDIWTGANWNERETYDMFGIRFEGHPDFRRVYLPEDFEHFPLRKEFPLLGIPGSLGLPHTTPDRE